MLISAGRMEMGKHGTRDADLCMLHWLHTHAKCTILYKKNTKTPPRLSPPFPRGYLQCACLSAPSWSIMNASDARPPSPPPCTSPLHPQIFSLIAFLPALYLLCPPPVQFPCNEPEWQAAQCSSVFCCVRLADAFCVCGSVWVLLSEEETVLWVELLLSVGAYKDVSLCLCPSTTYWHQQCSCSESLHLYLKGT